MYMTDQAEPVTGVIFAFDAEIAALFAREGGKFASIDINGARLRK